ncbi:MAG TPA: ABC transporter permease [Stellaceae bacterium]|nr:ABC transporter permease [Stellaceae bacterium]
MSASIALPLRRIAAIVLRHLYLMRGSWPRALELVYWPTMTMIVWGFTTQFLNTNSSWVAQAAGVLIYAVLLWEIVLRSQFGVAFSFLEEMWSRNLGHLFVSPLTPVEWVLSLLAMSVIRVLFGVLPAALLAIPLYHYSVFDLGLPLLAFFTVLLVMGWAFGLGVVALILRKGLGAENFAWVAIFVLAPISGIYYPIAVLPAWLQPVAWSLPTSYVFEGMRAVLFQHAFRVDYLLTALALDTLYIGLGALLLLWSFRYARHTGALLQMGE